MNLIVYIKGISKSAKGPAAISAIVCDNWGRVLKKTSLFIGEATGLRADFTALLSGIESAIESGATSIKIFADSEALIRHMSGTSKVKEDEIADLLSDIKSMSDGIFTEFIQIHPSRNREAEALVLAALEQHHKESEMETPAPRQRPQPVKSDRPQQRQHPKQAAVAAFKRAMLFDDITKSKEEIKPEKEPVSNDIIPEEKEEQQISAGGVVYKKEGNRIMVCLISKKNDRIWAFPKGRVMPGEHLEDTARREIAEETGHLTQVTDILDEISYYFYVKEENTLYHKTVYFFLMPLLEENFCEPDGEADSIMWLPIGDAYRKLTYINEKEILRKAQKIFAATH